MWLRKSTRVRGVTAASDRVDELVLGQSRLGQRGDAHRRPCDAGDLVPEHPHGAVLVARDDDLVTGPEIERAGDGVQPGRGVRDKAEIVGARRAHEAGDRLAHSAQPLVEVAGEEQDGLGLHLAP